MSETKTPPPPPPTPVAEGRQRGRPVGSTRITEPRQSTAVWLPASLHDKLIRLSAAEEQSVSATIRQLLILKL